MIHKSKLALVALSFVTTFLLVEGALRCSEYFRDYGIETIHDKQLGVRFRPNDWGLDAGGYRNRRSPAEAEIITLGDSQTWGVSATVDDAWPSELERMAGRPVYNMSVGGWSIAQYALILSDALRFRPRIIVIALYFGNDLWETYHSVYTLDGYRSLRRNEPLLDPLSDPTEGRAAEFRRSRKVFLDSYGGWPPARWPGWALRHTAIGRLWNQGLVSIGIAEDAWFQAGAAWALSDPDDVVKCRAGNVSTILTPKYRLLSLNLDEPRIREGLRLTKELFEEINSRVAGEPARLLYVLIPTKESVFDACLADLEDSPATLASLVRNEETARRTFLTWCSAQSAACLDLLPSMREAARMEKQIYPRSEDGHPNAAGYLVIAKRVNQELRSLAW